ncbi:unnamed protein product [Calypogeia fissa]
MDSDDDIDVLVAHHVNIISAVAEDDEATEKILNAQHGESRPERAPNLFGDHVGGHERIWDDYFCENPVYPSHTFRRRFPMRKSVFFKIHDKLVEHVPYFVQRPDAVGSPSLSSIQKVTAALRMFCYGIAVDGVDEYVRISESTATAAFKQFANGVVELFGDEYLRHPTKEDVVRHMEINTRRGWPGMFGSLDCSHWVWRNCPVALQGQFRDKDGENSIVLEAIATQNLWIWHAYVGVPRSNNDINVVDCSPLLVDLLNGVTNVFFHVNGHRYNMYYLLTDGIYPNYSIFLKTISLPGNPKRTNFACKQEGARKDVEWCFGVLQARFAITTNPSRLWSLSTMETVWKAAIIMHNMIIEDEEDEDDLNHDYLFENQPQFVNRPPQQPLTFARLSTTMEEITNEGIQNQLKKDLVEHLWAVRGNEEK